jgi:triosephosphate isomerase
LTAEKRRRGFPSPPIKAAATARSLSQAVHGRPVVYGGSLEPHNVSDYIHLPELWLDFLSASLLEVDSFLDIWVP